MKVLIVENEAGKRDRIIRVLEKNKITDYYVEEFVENAIETATSTKIDFLITDLGLSWSADKPEVKGKLGFKMLLELAERGIRIPTIIYSFSPFFDADKQELEKMEIPFIVHVVDDVILEYFLIREIEKRNSG